MSKFDKTLDVIEEKNGVLFCEITFDEMETQPEKRFHVVRISNDRRQVFDAIPSDAPNSGAWFSKFNADGVCYVSNGRTRKTARKWFNLLSA